MDTKANDHQILPKNITKAQARDTGMAMVLICLIVGIFTHNNGWNVAAIALLVLNMTWPSAYTPVAYVWLGLSGLLGSVVSKVLLSIVFFVVVTPIAVLRRMMGKDSMRLKAFKQGQESVMVVRDHTYTAQDVEQPF